jgi:hypothetical protein
MKALVRASKQTVKEFVANLDRKLCNSNVTMIRDGI